MQPGDLEPAIRRMFAGDRLESRIATLSQDMAFYRWTMEGRCYRLTMSKLDIVTRTTEQLYDYIVGGLGGSLDFEANP